MKNKEGNARMHMLVVVGTSQRHGGNGDQPFPLGTLPLGAGVFLPTIGEMDYT